MVGKGLDNLNILKNSSSAIIIFFHQSVTLVTDVGDIKIELLCDEAPKACEVRLNVKMRLDSCYTYAF